MEQVDLAPPESKSDDSESKNGAGGAGAGSRRRGRPTLSLTHSLSMTHNSTRILDHIFLGGQEACSEQSTMAFLKITHVLNVSCECANLFPGRRLGGWGGGCCAVRCALAELGMALLS